MHVAVICNNMATTMSELLDAQSHVWNHIFSYFSSVSLKCAIQLRIPDAIHQHGKPITLPRLVEALQINERKSHGIFRLMRILTHSKFFVKVKVKVSESESEEGYGLTPSSRLLLRDEPFTLAPLALAMIDPLLIDPFHRASEWFLDECSTPFVTKHGSTFWEHLGENEEGKELFNEGMASDARFVANVLTNDNECKNVFEGLESLVDVGGGTGVLAKGIAEAFPEMKCVVLELPQVVDGMAGEKNLTYVSGDMWDRIPRADAVLLKCILHDWNDEECVTLLGKCKEALIGSKNTNGGKVIIIDMVVGDEGEEKGATSYETKLFLDLLMMVAVTGKERNEKEWAELFFAAGYSRYKITRALGLRSVIEVFP